MKLHTRTKGVGSLRHKGHTKDDLLGRCWGQTSCNFQNVNMFDTYFGWNCKCSWSKCGVWARPSSKILLWHQHTDRGIKCRIGWIKYQYSVARLFRVFLKVFSDTVRGITLLFVYILWGEWYCGYWYVYTKLFEKLTHTYDLIKFDFQSLFYWHDVKNSQTDYSLFNKNMRIY